MAKGFRLRVLLLTCALQVFCCAETAKPDIPTQAAALAKAGKVDQAEAMLRSASAAEPDSATLHAALGELLLKEHKFEDSVMELGTAAQQKPDSREYNLLAAEALIGWKRYPIAVEFLKAVQPRFGNDARFHYELGLAYYFQSNMNAAVPELEAAVRLSPTLERARFLLANCLLVSGDTERALAILRKLAKEHPDNAFYWATLGEKLGHVNTGGTPEEAVRAVRRALTLAPDDSYTQFLAATVFTETGNYTSARPLLEHLEQLAPQALDVHALLARVYARLGERELAQKETAAVEKLQKEEEARHFSSTGGENSGQEQP